MDLKKVIATVPLLRRGWRLLPGPLKLPVLVAGGVYWLYRRGRGETDPTSG